MTDLIDSDHEWYVVYRCKLNLLLSIFDKKMRYERVLTCDDAWCTRINILLLLIESWRCDCYYTVLITHFQDNYDMMMTALELTFNQYLENCFRLDRHITWWLAVAHWLRANNDPYVLVRKSPAAIGSMIALDDTPIGCTCSLYI